MKNLSKRNIPLIYQGSIDEPVITAENYQKWYSLYVVYPDGTVKEIPTEVIDEVNNKSKDQLWIDHYFHPTLLLLLAQHYGGRADMISLEVAAGRWAMCLNESANSPEFMYSID